jgi:hypothetical protein
MTGLSHNFTLSTFLKGFRGFFLKILSNCSLSSVGLFQGMMFADVRFQFVGMISTRSKEVKSRRPSFSVFISFGVCFCCSRNDNYFADAVVLSLRWCSVSYFDWHTFSLELWSRPPVWSQWRSKQVLDLWNDTPYYRTLVESRGSWCQTAIEVYVILSSYYRNFQIIMFSERIKTISVAIRQGGLKKWIRWLVYVIHSFRFRHSDDGETGPIPSDC